MKIADKKIDKKVLLLAKKLRAAHPAAEIFLVGGVVRDLLLKRPIKDYDLVVCGLAISKLEKFLKAQGRVELVGKRFGVFKIDNYIDIALPRTEHVVTGSGGYKDFAVQSDPDLPLVTDLSRRDFTINAMAYDLLSKKLIDPYDGQKDLVKKQIKTVGVAAKRFAEDYSRLLRAIRFACQLDFTISPATWSVLKKLVNNINKKSSGQFVVPRETVAKELLKTFKTNPLRAWQLFDESGLAKILLPEMLKMKKCPQPAEWHSEGDVWTHTQLCLKNLTHPTFKKAWGRDPVSTNLLWAILWHDLGKPATLKIERAAGQKKLHFWGHDTVGAVIAKQLGGRLKLSAYKDNQIDFDLDSVVWLIDKHMLTSQTTVAVMKETTLEKYFFNPRYPGRDLQKLIMIDLLSSLRPNGRPHLEVYQALKKRIDALAKRQKGKKILPPPLLDGRQIMKLLNIKPGPDLGQILLDLREAQLSGKLSDIKTAKQWLKKTYQK